MARLRVHPTMTSHRRMAAARAAGGILAAVRSDYVAGGLVAAYQQPRFRRDNTEGYTDEHLADLNRHYEARLATYSAQDRCEKSVRDYVAERARVEFDALNRL